MSTIQAIILAIIEGITEFLPISSTGHMALASAFMGIHEQSFTKLFEVVIQFGAILAVVVLYWRRFVNFRNPGFYYKLLVAVIPALAFGALFKKHIEAVLGQPMVIATVLVVGGILLLFVDRWFNHGTTDTDEKITYRQSFFVGLFQVLAILFPGLSRSAATIVGGMQQGLTRERAAEFSFYLAVPTMLAATAKSLLDVYKDDPEVLRSGTSLILLGSVVAFFVAMASIRFLITWLKKHGFRAFGWYRIFAGAIILILLATGHYGH
jgi:undecaprenyl-diphosphatase